MEVHEEHVIGRWQKGDPYNKVAKNLTKLCSCSSVLWRVENLGVITLNFS